MPDMPPGWTLGPIGDFTQQENSRAGQRTSVVLSSTKHRGLVPSVEFFKNRQIFSNDTSDYRLVRRGWFAYATNHLSEGSIGLQESYDEACVSPIYTVFSCAESVDPRYFFRVLKSPDLIRAYSLHEQASVDRRGAVRYRDFAKIQVAVPSLPEQRKIVEILDAMDESIRSTERLIAKLELVRSGQMMDLIDSQWTARDWDSARLGEVLARRPKNGMSPVEAAKFTGAYILGLGCLTMHGFAPTQLKNAPPWRSTMSVARLNPGDLLITRANTRDLVGMVGIYQDVGTKCIYPDLMMKLSPTNRVRSDFLELLLRSNPTRKQIRSLASGTSESMVKISGSIVMSLQVRIPPVREQERIVNVHNTHRDGISIARAELTKLQRVKNGLMGDLLSGRVQVSV